MSEPESVLRKIEWMKARGSGLTFNWSEGEGCWEVTWIMWGKPYSGNGATLDEALHCVQAATREDWLKRNP